MFDLETVPDLSAGRALLNADDATPDEQLRNLLGERYRKEKEDSATAFIKVPLQKVVCIGALYAEADERGVWNVTRAGVGHIQQRSERDLIDRFIDSLAEQPAPQLVGFNSSGFDLPLLRYRAFALAVPAHVLHGGNGKDYWYRYGRDHIDVCDFISGFGASAKPSLAELAALCGVPAKVGGIDGSQVEEMVRAGKLEEVAAYCETDVYTTYLVFLRLSLVAGWIDQKAYEESLAGVEEHLADRASKRPHLQAYLDAIRSLPRQEA